MKAVTSIDTILAALRAAADPTRLRLLALLSGGELTVSEMTQILGQSQPRVSRHLKLMGEAGLLERLREGSWVFYRLAEPVREGGSAASLARDLVGRISQTDPTIARDAERLAMVRAARAAQAEAYFRANAERWDQLRALHLPDRDVERVLRDLVGPGEIGLHVDLGTGTGRMLLLFADQVTRGLGLDVSHEMLTVARTALEARGAGHLTVRQGDIAAPPIEAGAADLVTLHLVLHYLDDAGSALAEAARLLRPGGRLLIVDFAPHELEFLREDHAHRRLGFDEREITALGTAAGLRLVRTVHLPPSAEGATGGGTDDRLTLTVWLFEAAAPLPPAPTTPTWDETPSR
ncbi:MAG: metalloregulator ArsR/SmtB family transcription factor [Alphaproteobacteria bacterium]|nr:metalloregulator ArsR/SmtB family transcription factor [Alphaproteobacteria bacterium]